MYEKKKCELQFQIWDTQKNVTIFLSFVLYLLPSCAEALLWIVFLQVRGGLDSFDRDFFRLLSFHLRDFLLTVSQGAEWELTVKVVWVVGLHGLTLDSRLDPRVPRADTRHSDDPSQDRAGTLHDPSIALTEAWDDVPWFSVSCPESNRRVNAIPMLVRIVQRIICLEVRWRSEKSARRLSRVAANWHSSKERDDSRRSTWSSRWV